MYPLIFSCENMKTSIQSSLDTVEDENYKVFIKILQRKLMTSNLDIFKSTWTIHNVKKYFFKEKFARRFLIFLFNTFRDVRFKIWSHLNMNSWCIDFLILSFSKIFLGFWGHFWRQIQKFNFLFYSRLSPLIHNFVGSSFHFNLLWHHFQFLLFEMFFPHQQKFFTPLQKFFTPSSFWKKIYINIHDSYMTNYTLGLWKVFLPTISTMGGVKN